MTTGSISHIIVSVAQLDRAQRYERWGREFESLRRRHCKRDKMFSIGESSNGRTPDFDSGSRGSSPFSPANFRGVSSVVVTHLSVKQVTRVRFPLSPQVCLRNSVDRVAGFEPVSREFESLRGLQNKFNQGSNT